MVMYVYLGNNFYIATFLIWVILALYKNWFQVTIFVNPKCQIVVSRVCIFVPAYTLHL